MRSELSFLSCVVWAPLCALLVAGCSHEAAAPEAAAPSTAAAPDQIAEGQRLYVASCAKCHGATGAGDAKVPPVVGPQALPLDPRPGSKRTAKFHTGADVFTYVKANMPGDAPGSLSDDQVAAIMAFDLKANGVDLKGAHVDAAAAAGVVLHP